MSGTQITLGPADAGAPLTAGEFAAAEFSPPFVYERVRGRLAVMSPAGPEHRGTSRPFRRQLGLYWGLHPEAVDEVDIEGWVRTSPQDDRIPDICVYLRGPRSAQSVPQRVPELIFEFVSADRSDQERDYIAKRGEYHAIGVQEYVIVDRFLQAALVLRWQAAGYAEQALARNDFYSTPLLAGLSVSLAECFSALR